MAKRLIKSGYSQQRLADEVKRRGVACSQPTIWRVINLPDFDPSYRVGKAIADIYTDEIADKAA